MKCLEGIRHLVREAAVVDLAPQILASILDPEAAAMVQAHVEKQGVTFLSGQQRHALCPWGSAAAQWRDHSLRCAGHGRGRAAGNNAGHVHEAGDAARRHSHR